MGPKFRDAQHILRPLLVLAVAFFTFLLLRGLLVPDTFGDLGHYRAAALEEIRNQPVVYAGQSACADCHDEAVTARANGKHAGVACEACHGPLARHAADPEIVPVRPDPVQLCARCHESHPAKPPEFPQVVTREHYPGNSCESCHTPHSPGL